MTSLSVRKRLLLRQASELIELSPDLYRAAMLTRYRTSWFKTRIISPAHDVSIESYPRSASSFAVRAFKAENPTASVATHTHSPAQVVLAARWGVPSMVLIRDPAGAIISNLALLSQASGESFSEEERDQLVASNTKRYARFHERINPYRDSFVLVSFSEATTNLGAAIDRLNHKFGTEFTRFELNSDSVKRVHAGAGFHQAPSGERDCIKEAWKESYFDERNAELRKRCDRIWSELSGTL